MRNTLILLLLIAAGSYRDMFAQTAKAGDAGKAIPDLSGIWQLRRPVPFALLGACGPADAAECIPESAKDKVSAARPGPSGTLDKEEVPMLPWAEKRYKAVWAGKDADNRLEDVDPWFSGCMPVGPTRSLTLGIFELRQFPGLVLILIENSHLMRRIYTDGRGHPPGHPISWMGHSIGHYDGDTLVVDTVGINEKAWIDGQARPHSNALHLTERLRRVDSKSMEYEFTIDDPIAYSKPWTRKRMEDLLPPGSKVYEHVQCEELLQMGKHFVAESDKP